MSSTSRPRLLLPTFVLLACTSQTSASTPTADTSQAPAPKSEPEPEPEPKPAPAPKPEPEFDPNEWPVVANELLNDPMSVRLEQTARTHDEGTIERLALSDVAFPDDPQEAIDMQGFTIMMVTATTHDPSELPPKRVYTDCGGDQTELSSIVQRNVRQETDWARSVGRFRFDGFFLLPLQHMTRPECKLTIDWAVNREAQTFELDRGVPLEVPVMPPLAKPAEGVIWAMLEREYSFMFEE